MRRVAIAVSAGFGLMPLPALAADWSLRTTQSQIVELNSNLFLNTPPAGVIGSYSYLSANAEARTPTTRFNLDADGSYRKNWVQAGAQPGANSASEFINYGFKSRYEIKEKTAQDREYVEASWRQQSTSLALLNELGALAPVRGFINRLSVGGGVDRALTYLDTISVSAGSTRTTYEPAVGGTQFTDTHASGSWSHRLSATTALNATSQAELLDYDNPFNTRVQIYSNQAGADVALSPVLSARGMAGWIHVSTQRGLPLTGPARPVPSTGNDWIANAVLTYKMFRDTTLVLNAEQSIGPSIVGTLLKRDTVGATLNYTINSHSQLSLSANGNRQIANNTTTDFVSASTSYSHNFTREWSGQLSYRYLHRFASNGTTIFDPTTGLPTVSGLGAADSHSILMVISHTYVVLPPGN